MVDIGDAYSRSGSGTQHRGIQTCLPQCSGDPGDVWIGEVCGGLAELIKRPNTHTRTHTHTHILYIYINIYVTCTCMPIYIHTHTHIYIYI